MIARLCMLAVLAVVLGTLLRWGFGAYHAGGLVGRLLANPITEGRP